jgi:hypothetical protein
LDGIKTAKQSIFVTQPQSLAVEHPQDSGTDPELSTIGEVGEEDGGQESDKGSNVEDQEDEDNEADGQEGTSEDEPESEEDDEGDGAHIPHSQVSYHLYPGLG